MKQKFMLVVSVGLVIIVTLLAVQHYQTNKNTKEAQKVEQQNSQITKLQAALETEQKKSASYEQAYQAQRLECEKGASNVAKVPPALQKALITPKCGPAVLP
jgi:type II secretory pathway pseudopilin PulG